MSSLILVTETIVFLLKVNERKFAKQLLGLANSATAATLGSLDASMRK